MERLGAGTIQLQTRAVEDGRGRRANGGDPRAGPRPRP
jgi:hypothetical protein